MSRLVELDARTYVGTRAQVYEKLGMHEQAARDYDLAVKLDPENWLLFRANYRIKRHQLDLALDDFQLMIDRTRTLLAQADCENESWLRFLLASTYLHRARHYESNFLLDLAQDDLMCAVEIDSACLQPCADFCEKYGLWSSYLDCLNALVEECPARHLNRRGAFYESQSQQELAEKDYDLLVKISRKCGLWWCSPLAWALKYRAGFYRRTGRPKAALIDEVKSKIYTFGFFQLPKFVSARTS